MSRVPGDDELLLKKLGIKEGYRVAILNAPSEYRKILHESRSIDVTETLVGRLLDFIHYFAVTGVELRREFPSLERSLTLTGALWISWPKRSSGIKTDLDDNVVREIGLSNGLVDVKIIAVDETWSGLKFVRRLRDR